MPRCHPDQRAGVNKAALTFASKRQAAMQLRGSRRSEAEQAWVTVTSRISSRQWTLCPSVASPEARAEPRTLEGPRVGISAVAIQVFNDAPPAPISPRPPLTSYMT